jgi:hypothetical protein
MTMNDRQLPHDPYIHAVADALTFAGREPDNWWTSDAEVNRYDTGPDAGCTMQLDAYLEWDTSDAHEHGIALIWEHPAEQWQWAPRRADGVLARDPEFLPCLPRWAFPNGVAEILRALLAGRPLPERPKEVWYRHAEMQAAVDAWAADDANQ